MAGVPAGVAQNIDFLEVRPRRQHLEQHRVQGRLIEAQLQRIERHLAGTGTACRAADAGDLLIAEREICQRKELVAVRSERAAIAQREPDKIVLCLQRTPR